MLLMIDNYDSFTYNLVQYLGELGQVIEVYRNDKIEVDDIMRLKPDRIILCNNSRIDNPKLNQRVSRKCHSYFWVFKKCNIKNLN